MKRPKHLKQVNEIVDAAAKGTVYVPSDFYDIAKAADIGMCLKRLIENNKLNRIMRGIYVKPGNVPPPPDSVAKAIARNYGWTVIPCGDTAMYMSGLSYKKPDTWTYVSDGQYKTYKVDGVEIKFKHSNNYNETTEISYKTALYIQAIRAIGKDNVTNEIIRKIAKKLGINERLKFQLGVQRVAAWIKVICNKIYEESLNNVYYGNKNLQDIYPNETKISTLFGDEFRSKSEALIATALHITGIDFQYDKCLTDINGTPYWPDFTIHYKGQEYYWEHLGMLDNKKYVQDWYVKQKWYNMNFPGRILTTTDFEDIGKQIRKVLHDSFSCNIAEYIC